MATSTIKSINAGIDIPYDLPISSSSWTETSGKYIHTYTDNRITQGCRIEITFKAGTFNTELPYIEFEKGTGSIDFTASVIPTVAVPIVIHIINAQAGSNQAVSATDVATSGDAQTLGANVNSSLIALNGQIANFSLCSPGTIVDIKSYNSNTNTFIVPCDGYGNLEVTTNTWATIYWKGCDIPLVSCKSFTSGENARSNVYLRKGMEIYVGYGNASNVVIKFIPFINSIP